jgi:P4 family phage/plasmid primase-like protien
MLEFIKENRLIFSPVNIEIKNDKKEYEGLIKDWKNQTYEKCLNNYTKNISNYLNNPYYLIKCDNNFIIFDTDTNEDYNKLCEILIYLGLYNHKSITKSTRGNMYAYKRHFWFKVEDEKFKNFLKHKLGDLEVFIGNNCNICELKISMISDINILSYDNYKQIMIEFSKDLENCKKLTDYEFITDDRTNKEILLILDKLNIKRYDNYDYWIILYFIFVNEKLNLNIYEKYSKKSLKYNKERNDEILKNIVPKKGYTLATLYLWLKEDNLLIFNELNKKNRNFWNIQINHASIADLYFEIDPDTYIYTHNNGWYEYNQNNILIHRGDKPASLINKMSKILQEYSTSQRNLITPEEEHYKKYMEFYGKFYNKVGSTDFIKNTIEQLKNHYYQELDCELNNVNLFAFNNKVYDYKYNVYREIRKSDYITKTTNYEYDEKLINKETRKKIYDFLYSLFEDNQIVEYWLKITSMALFGNEKQQKFYMFNGKGSNGKSLTQKIISLALGDYYKAVSNNFLVGSIKKGGADAELAGCQGIRYLSVSEPDDQDNKKFNISNLKNWSGGDKLQARGLYQKNMIEFYALFTIFINCNDLPELSNTDDGIKRRLRNIFFPFQFKEASELKKNKNYRLLNNNLSDELTSNIFIMNFINLLIEYAYKNKNVLIETPLSVLTASNKYCDDNNPLYEWLSETFEITNNETDRHTASTLLNEYNSSPYCNKKMNSVEFSKYMEKLNIEKITPKNVRTYIKIKLREHDEF